jgi:mRNA-degrading endonuclease RelE of RelBE toxin-antitoxin system
VPYIFKATPEFFEALNALPPEQQAIACEKFKVFQKDPFDPCLGTHRIRRLSSLYKTTIWSVRVMNDLRSIFRIDGNVVTSIDIGNHDIYG